MSAMSSTFGNYSDGADSVATAKALSASRKQKKRSDKCNLRRGEPLKSGLLSSAPPRSKSSSNDEKQLLQQCQAIYSKLPKRSKYAQHRLKCLAKAMELLQHGRAARTNEENEELQRLLGSLNIGGTAS